MMNRRGFVIQLSGVMAAGVLGRRLFAEVTGSGGKPTAITVYKSKSCGCCVEWVDYLRQNGFEPTVHDEEDMDAIKAELGVPGGVRSCHTAVVDKYLIEGHVPAADIKRLLAERPKATGLAVPGMPPHTPGMAVGGGENRGLRGRCFPARRYHQDVRALLAPDESTTAPQRPITNRRQRPALCAAGDPVRGRNGNDATGIGDGRLAHIPAPSWHRNTIEVTGKTVESLAERLSRAQGTVSGRSPLRLQRGKTFDRATGQDPVGSEVGGRAMDRRYVGQCGDGRFLLGVTNASPAIRVRSSSRKNATCPGV